MEPVRSSTKVMRTVAALDCAAEETFNVRNEGNRPIKKVLVVTLALMLMSVLPLASVVNGGIVTTGGAVSRSEVV